MILPTVKIKADNKSGFIVINESDFDQKLHVLFSEPAEEKQIDDKPSVRKTRKRF